MPKYSFLEFTFKMHLKLFRNSVFLLLLLLPAIVSYSQTFIGGGYGTYNIRGAGKQLRGFCPTLKVEQIFNSQRITAYADVSYFSKEVQEESVMFYDNSGNLIGSADSKTNFSYLYSQIG